MNEAVMRAVLNAYNALGHTVPDGIYLTPNRIPEWCRWCAGAMYPHKHGALLCLTCDTADRRIVL